MIIAPCYHNGFAPRDYQPALPQLWAGCIGAWCPSLGPSGITLYDWSARKNHGTLTNTTLNTVWGASEGQHVLNLDGSDDYVASSLSLTQTFSVSMWVNPSDVTAFVQKICFSLIDAGAPDLYFGLVGATVNVFYNSGTSLSASFNMSVGTWYHLAVQRYGDSVTNGIEIWVNAVRKAQATPSTLSAQSGIRIGRRGDGTASPWPGFIDDVRVYDRVLAPNEIVLLASQRGVAYTPARRSGIALAVDAANRRRRLLMGVPA